MFVIICQLLSLASIGDILATEPSSDVKKHQQPQNTTGILYSDVLFAILISSIIASDADLSVKPSSDHKRCEPQSHSTAGKVHHCTAICLLLLVIFYHWLQELPLKDVAYSNVAW